MSDFPSRSGGLAVLTSGGLDSAVLVADLREQGYVVQPIYVRFGLAWEPVEEARLRRFLHSLPSGPGLQPLVVLEQPVADLYGVHWSVSGRNVPDAASPDAAVYLPGRNLLLLAKASVWCALNGVRAIALGTLKGVDVVQRSDKEGMCPRNGCRLQTRARVARWRQGHRPG